MPPGQPGMYSGPQQGQGAQFPQGQPMGQPYGGSGYPPQGGVGQQVPGGMSGQGGFIGQQGAYGQGFAGKPGFAGPQGPGGFPGMQSGGMGGFAGGQQFQGQPGNFPSQSGYGGMQSQAGMGLGGQSTFQAPTTFQVRRNFFAYGGEMDILMNGVPHFRCLSSPSPLGYGFVFNLTDMNGNQLCYIQPDQSYGAPHFHIFLRGALFAILKQDWNPSEKKFELHNKQTGEELKVYGDWFGQNFEFQRRHGGQQVAQVSSGSGNGDLYDVIVYPGEDALFILAATLSIEKVCHEHKHHHKHSW